MKNVFRGVALALALVLLALLGALAAALQREPAVVLQQPPGHEDVARALAVMRANDPRRVRPGVVSALQLSERDVDVLLNHAAYRYLGAAMRVGFERGAATVLASVLLPRNPFGSWLNVRARLVETGALPQVDTLKVGRLPLPAWLGAWLLVRQAERAGLLEELHAAAAVVRRVSFLPQQMGVVYAWRDGSADRLLAGLMPAAEQQRLRVYAEGLAQLSAQQRPGRTVSLPVLLAPMFDLARQRSAAPDADAAAENRAAIVVLTLFVNGMGVDVLLPAARSWPRARPLQVTLAGRDDFPRHLLVSAALAVEGTSPLSKAIGVYKEVADSRGGTGFSFDDMAANRAGTRLGELAMTQPRRLQSVLAQGVQEADILPAWADLPSFMQEAEFKRRFGGIGAPAYRAMIAEIDRRVDGLAALR